MKDHLRLTPSQVRVVAVWPSRRRICSGAVPHGLLAVVEATVWGLLGRPLVVVGAGGRALAVGANELAMPPAWDAYDETAGRFRRPRLLTRCNGSVNRQAVHVAKSLRHVDEGMMGFDTPWEKKSGSFSSDERTGSRAEADSASRRGVSFWALSLARRRLM